ncbi:hypothetical protein F2Q68_00025813 [Brassica cretica]|uniref:P-type ATPase A domain-containing protein n=1 Tax=Brassica cretica TaxID=69181 RepID=A0A8S9IKA2_BRACR|nr:hypothetical protein F2Q68_00025813 [Brassica cretica]
MAKGKTSQAIAKLMNLAPDTAILLTVDEEGNVTGEEEIDGRLIQKNDVIKIVPGAKVASDGCVIWGQSHVNESMITGEARPVAKRKGDTVIGGTLNENGVLHIKVTKVGSESALAQIVRLVESAQLAKAPHCMGATLPERRHELAHHLRFRATLPERQSEVAPAPRATSPQRHPEVARVYVDLRETNKPGATSHSDHLRSLPAPRATSRSDVPRSLRVIYSVETYDFRGTFWTVVTIFFKRNQWIEV